MELQRIEACARILTTFSLGFSRGTEAAPDRVRAVYGESRGVSTGRAAGAKPPQATLRANGTSIAKVEFVGAEINLELKALSSFAQQ